MGPQKNSRNEMKFHELKTHTGWNCVTCELDLGGREINLNLINYNVLWLHGNFHMRVRRATFVTFKHSTFFVASLLIVFFDNEKEANLLARFSTTKSFRKSKKEKICVLTCGLISQLNLFYDVKWRNYIHKKSFPLVTYCDKKKTCGNQSQKNVIHLNSE